MSLVDCNVQGILSTLIEGIQICTSMCQFFKEFLYYAMNIPRGTLKSSNVHCVLVTIQECGTVSKALSRGSFDVRGFEGYPTSSGRVETESGGTQRCTGEVKGKEANGVGNQAGFSLTQNRPSSVTTIVLARPALQESQYSTELTPPPM